MQVNESKWTAGVNLHQLSEDGSVFDRALLGRKLGIWQPGERNLVIANRM